MTTYYPLTLQILNFTKQNSYDIELHSGDTDEALIFQIVDAQGNPLNATNFTVALKIVNPFYASYEASGTAAWTNVLTGIFTYTPAPTDFETIGLYKVTATLTNSSLLLTTPTENYLILNVT